MPTVFITGGARRLGRAIALRFAQHGYDVGFSYHTSAGDAERTRGMITDIGRRVHVVRADVAVPTDLTNAMDAVVEHLGAPSVVVSNAGVFPDANAHVMADEVQATIAVNTLPIITLARAMERHRSTEIGRLIAISSLGGQEIWNDRLAYNVSKTALNTAIRSLARTLAPHITVNAVAPGALEQPGETQASDAGRVSSSRIPMQRYGTADDVIDAVWFFATASSYITGQILAVDGGYGMVRTS